MMKGYVTMENFDKECLQVFLENQTKLFKEPVVRTMGETKEYLQEIMAVVVDSNKEVVKYFEENGADIAGMSEEEIINQAEVFPLKKTGRYLIVEA